MANELVARHGLRVSGSTYISSVATDQSLLSNVLTIDPSNNEVKDLSLATFAADFITGGTLSGTGNKDLVLEQYDGSSVTISDVNLHVTGGTFDAASGDITLSLNDLSDVTVALGTDFVTGVTEANNIITVGVAGAGTTDYNITALTGLTQTGNDISFAGSDSASGSVAIEAFTGVSIASNVITLAGSNLSDDSVTVDAVTSLAYSSDWAISGETTGTASGGPVELPFITGGSYNAGTDTLTLGINGGLESDITISGFEGSDTFLTGATVGSGDGNVTFELNDPTEDFTASGFNFVTSGDSGTSTINLQSSLSIVGDTGITTVDNGSGQISIDLDDTAVSAGVYGDASTVATFDVDAQGRLIGATGVTIDITASQVNDFDTAAESAIFIDGNFVDSSNIDFTVTAGESVTADLKDTGVVAGNYGSDSQVAVFDVDAKGRITAVSGETIDGANINNNTVTINPSGAGSASFNLGGPAFIFDSPDNSILISGDSSSTISFVVADSVDTKITGGTYTDNTGVLTLTDNDGTVITVDGEWNHLESASIASNVITFTSNTGETSNVTVAAVTGGTFDAATGIITVAGSGTISNIDLGTDFVTGVTEADNVITVGNAGGGTTDYTIQAVTAVTYNNDWDIALDGTGSLGTTPVDLPFITGGTYSSGTITLGVNGGLESDIAITGLTNTDTHVTGATVEYTGATLEFNQSAPDVEISSEQTIRVSRTGAGALFSVNINDYKAVHVEYTITEGAGAARSGFFTAIFHGNQVEYSDFSTMDIGAFTQAVEISASDAGVISVSGSGSVSVIANTRAVAI